VESKNSIIIEKQSEAMKIIFIAYAFSKRDNNVCMNTTRDVVAATATAQRQW